MARESRQAAATNSIMIAGIPVLVRFRGYNTRIRPRSHAGSPVLVGTMSGFVAPFVGIIDMKLYLQVPEKLGRVVVSTSSPRL